MYKPWTAVNIFMVSFLHLLQGSEHGSVKRSFPFWYVAASKQSGRAVQTAGASSTDRARPHAWMALDPWNARAEGVIWSALAPATRRSYMTKRTSLSALEWSEQQIRKAANLEELLRITHSEDWKLWKCRLKLKSVASMDSRSASHRSTRFAAAFYDIDILKIIDEEWQRTQCVPRETCVEVAKELGTTTNKFFKPPCVNVYRCGGCCNEESLSCMNTSTSYISKMLFEISVPLTNVPDPVQVKIANHTGCKCLSNVQRQPYTIIRRSVQYPEEDRCLHINKLCHNGWIWDSNKCECVVDKEGLPPLAELAMCAPNMDFDEESCECVCKWKCTDNLFQNKENCSCYMCAENQESCFQKHKTFNAETCSCEDKCPFQARMCPTTRPVCARHCRCLRGGRSSHGSQSKENP